ncbi:type VI secretion IcmF C-terminal domain-containing protein [Novosphingobium aquimarinum]|uniref:type VI secretion IcmF C-terminal domain-containing protein n=1 Tax=Novosphingobium aquimarinum TaxID=2682494 RepID=UPI001E5B2461|nr:type VI secretion IcmF C-terminal domain-containing protein [Novosphingobium aquimarinum]
MFGSGGLIDGFVSDRLAPLIDREGPVWRWVRDDPLTASLDPTSPQSFAKALAVRDLLLSGVPLKVQLTGKSADVSEVQFSSGGTTYRFKETGGTPRNIVWAGAGSLPEASVTFFAPEASEGAEGGAPAPLKETAKIETDGPWALFRLMDAGRMSNDGERRITVTFDRNGQSARFAITLPGESNPFSRGGLWSFRCPTTL